MNNSTVNNAALIIKELRDNANNENEKSDIAWIASELANLYAQTTSDFERYPFYDACGIK